jgi:hypothetical protein
MKCITPDEGCTILQDTMQGFVAVTRVLDVSWVRNIDRGSFGPLLCLTPTPWSVDVKVVSFLLARNMCRLMNCIPYLLPSLSLHGGWCDNPCI